MFRCAKAHFTGADSLCSIVHVDCTGLYMIVITNVIIIIYDYYY